MLAICWGWLIKEEYINPTEKVLINFAITSSVIFCLNLILGPLLLVFYYKYLNSSRDLISSRERHRLCGPWSSWCCCGSLGPQIEVEQEPVWEEEQLLSSYFQGEDLGWLDNFRTRISRLCSRWCCRCCSGAGKKELRSEIADVELRSNNDLTDAEVSRIILSTFQI